MNIEFIYHTQTNLICLILFVMIMIIHNRYNKTNTTETRITKRLIFLSCCYCVCDMITWWVDGRSSLFALILQFASNIAYICMPALISLVWLEFVCFRTESMDFLNSKWGHAMKGILWGGMATIATTPITNWGFIIDKQTHLYVRNWGAYVIPVMCFFVLSFTLAWIGIYIRSETHQNKREAAIPLLYFPIPVIIAGLLQIQVYGLSLNTVGFCFFIILVFLNQQFEKISLDELTGLGNRRNMKLHLNDLIHSLNKESIFLCMIDVDFFKSINDTYGHLEGDNALICVADTIKKVAGRQKSKLLLSRFGGDEFIIAGTDYSEEEIELLEQELREEMNRVNESLGKPYKLTLSIGHSLQTAEKISGAEQLLGVADERMYEVKKKRVK